MSLHKPLTQDNVCDLAILFKTVSEEQINGAEQDIDSMLLGYRDIRQDPVWNACEKWNNSELEVFDSHLIAFHMAIPHFSAHLQQDVLQYDPLI